MGVQIDRLRARVERSRSWPPRWVADAWDDVALWAAFRSNDKPRLREEAKWDDKPAPDAPRGWFPKTDEREYLVDPLPKKVSTAYADMNWSRPPEIRPGNEGDEERLEGLLRENRFAAAVRREAKTWSSEGEGWWRVRVDTELSDRAIIEWHSRGVVVPRIVGERVTAVAFVSRLDALEGDPEQHRWRLLEYNDGEHIENVLYEGDVDRLGEPVPLDRHPDTENLADQHPHGLPAMPAGRILNQEGESPFLGASDYEDLRDLFLALNETLTIGQENARLTLKRRVIVPSSALDESGKIPAGQEAIVAESVDQSLGGSKDGASAFKVLEYSFDAENLIRYDDHLAVKTLSRAGIDAFWAGVPTTDGNAPTGVAMRLRLVPTRNGADGRAADADDRLPHIVHLAQLLDAMPVEDGGAGQPWTDPDSPPTVARQQAVPLDPQEEAERHRALRDAGVESRRQAVRELHPDWDQQQVQDELDEIDEETSASGAGLPGAGGAATLFDTIANRNANGNGQPAEAEAEADAATAPTGGGAQQGS